jgi:hypothetical protein
MADLQRLRSDQIFSFKPLTPQNFIDQLSSDSTVKAAKDPDGNLVLTGGVASYTPRGYVPWAGTWAELQALSAMDLTSGDTGIGTDTELLYTWSGTAWDVGVALNLKNGDLFIIGQSLASLSSDRSAGDLIWIDDLVTTATWIFQPDRTALTRLSATEFSAKVTAGSLESGRLYYLIDATPPQSRYRAATGTATYITLGEGTVKLSSTQLSALASAQGLSPGTLYWVTDATDIRQALVLADTTSTYHQTDFAGALPQNRGGTGFTSYILGDMLYANEDGDLVKLAAGSNGQVMEINADGIPEWATFQGGNGFQQITVAQWNAGVTGGTLTEGAAYYVGKGEGSPFYGFGGMGTGAVTIRSNTTTGTRGQLILTRDGTAQLVGGTGLVQVANTGGVTVNGNGLYFNATASANMNASSDTIVAGVLATNHSSYGDVVITGNTAEKPSKITVGQNLFLQGADGNYFSTNADHVTMAGATNGSGTAVGYIQAYNNGEVNITAPAGLLINGDVGGPGRSLISLGGSQTPIWMLPQNWDVEAWVENYAPAPSTAYTIFGAASSPGPLFPSISDATIGSLVFLGNRRWRLSLGSVISNTYIGINELLFGLIFPTDSYKYFINPSAINVSSLRGNIYTAINNTGFMEVNLSSTFTLNQSGKAVYGISFICNWTNGIAADTTLCGNTEFLAW